MMVFKYPSNSPLTNHQILQVLPPKTNPSGYTSTDNKNKWKLTTSRLMLNLRDIDEEIPLTTSSIPTETTVVL